MPIAATKRDRDADLLGSIAEGDTDAFANLYSDYSKALFGSIYKVIGDRLLAEEILQDTFMKIWMNIHRYDPKKGALYTWMFNIARNLTIDRMRSSEYFKRSVTSTFEQEDEQMDNRLGGEEMHLFTNDILNQLPETQSMVLDLMYFQGFTSEDISKEFAIPLGTVKSRIRGGLIKLRKLYGIL
ncbi:MAG: sigma-70 family RNA polymerase sigma factor [Cytophagales bacterium]|nr:sigma-70 family RNA polymerase sigma factor [Cytophagales bacterium]